MDSSFFFSLTEANARMRWIVIWFLYEQKHPSQMPRTAVISRD